MELSKISTMTKQHNCHIRYKTSRNIKVEQNRTQTCTITAVTVSRRVLVVYLLDCNLIRRGSKSTELFDQKANVEESTAWTS